MDEIILGTPKMLLRPATIAGIDVDEINDSRIEYTIKWKDGNGEIYSQHFDLQGSDYNDVILDNVVSGDVGKKIGARLRARIIAKIKVVHGL